MQGIHAITVFILLYIYMYVCENINFINNFFMPESIIESKKGNGLKQDR